MEMGEFQIFWCTSVIDREKPRILRNMFVSLKSDFYPESEKKKEQIRHGELEDWVWGARKTSYQVAEKAPTSL